MKKFKLLSLLLCLVVQFSWCQTLTPDSSGMRQYPDADRFVYWFDSDTVTTSIGISNNPFDIDVSHLYPGLHTLHACLSDSLSNYYPAVSSLFFCQLPEDSLGKKIVYWFDSDDSLFVTNYSSNSFQIDVSSLETGYHTLHCMLADMTRGVTTAPDSTVFSIKVCDEADSSFVVASICQDETFSWRGKNYSEPGIYFDSLVADYSCDSVYKLTLTVNPTYLVNDTAILPSDGSGYLWHGQSYSVAGDYTDSYITILGCDSVYTLHLIDTTSTDVGVVSGISAVKIYVAPNPVSSGMVAYVYGEFGEVETVEILNNFGQVIDSFAPSSYPIEIEGLEVEGLYYVRIIARSGEIYTEKLLVK